jgi:hypothetical protein
MVALLASNAAGLNSSAAPALWLNQGAPQGQDTAHSQALFRRVEVFVTAASGTSVYFDGGLKDMISEGDAIVFFPASGPQQRGTIRIVSEASGRAELSSKTALVSVGDRAEVLVPESRFLSNKPAVGASGPNAVLDQERPGVGLPPGPAIAPVAHPPWEVDLGDVDPNAPLLAPIQSTPPEDRPYEIHGRYWLDLTATEDREGEGATYGTLRTGFDSRAENLFRQGGTVEFDTDFYRHSFDADDASNDTDSQIRIDRLNYRWGGNREQANTWQVGRFLSQGMPEFGVIDGLEYTRRTDDGAHWGVAMGGFPEPNDDLSTGSDVQAAVFYQWKSTDEKISLNSGFQKTWHDGKPDRDLLVMTSTWRPLDRLHVFSSLWVDLYDSDDQIKSGLELTQFISSASWRTKQGDGLGLSLSHFSFPELLRNEFDEITAEQIADDKVTRLGLNGWKNLTDTVRLRGRIDSWTDQDDSGGRVEGTVEFNDAILNDGDLSLSIFQNEGKFASGPGLRLRATKEVGGGWLRFTYESTETKSNDFFGAQDTLTNHVYRASWDRPLGQDWDLSLSLEQRDGDQEDASTIGFFLQRSFH